MHWPQTKNIYKRMHVHDTFSTVLLNFECMWILIIYIYIVSVSYLRFESPSLPLVLYMCIYLPSTNLDKDQINGKNRLYY